MKAGSAAAEGRGLEERGAGFEGRLDSGSRAQTEHGRGGLEDRQNCDAGEYGLRVGSHLNRASVGGGVA